MITSFKKCRTFQNLWNSSGKVALSALGIWYTNKCMQHVMPYLSSNHCRFQIDVTIVSWSSDVACMVTPWTVCFLTRCWKKQTWISIWDSERPHQTSVYSSKTSQTGSCCTNTDGFREITQLCSGHFSWSVCLTIIISPLYNEIICMVYFRNVLCPKISHQRHLCFTYIHI